MFDTTDRILRELEMMVKEGCFLSKPQLEKEVIELIKKVNAHGVNLFIFFTVTFFNMLFNCYCNKIKSYLFGEI